MPGEIMKNRMRWDLGVVWLVMAGAWVTPRMLRRSTAAWETTVELAPESTMTFRFLLLLNVVSTLISPFCVVRNGIMVMPGTSAFCAALSPIGGSERRP